MTKGKPITYPWIPIFVCLIIGVGSTHFIQIPPVYLSWGVVFMLALSRLILSKRMGCLFLLMTFIIIGILGVQVRYYKGERDIARIGRFYRKQTVSLRGTIISDVVHKEGMRGSKNVATLKAKEILSPWGWRPTSGKVLLQVFKKEMLSYGDVLEVDGKLHRPFHVEGGQHFSYRRYLQHKDIYYILSVKKSARLETSAKDQGHYVFKKIYNLRRALRQALERYLTKREAGVMSAMLLGDRSNMPKDIRALFVRTGTAHILAISGLHIGILTGLLFALLRFLPLSRKYQYVLLILILGIYVILSGLRASVLRATWMAIVFIGGLIWERKSFGLNSLAFAGCMLLAINPHLLFDVGFQLSFACVLFILLGASPLCHLGQRYMPRGLANLMAVSLCAFLGSAGLVVYYFGMITPISLLVNIAAVPLMSLVLVFGVGFLMTVFSCPFLAYYFSLFLKLSLNAMVAVIFVFDQCPGSYFYVSDVNYSYIIAYYILTALILGLFLRVSIIDK